MLTSQNSGKYLTRTYEEQRERCAQNKDRFTVVGRAFYDISGQSPGMGDREIMERTFMMETSPIDPLTKPHKYDQRDKLEVGH